MMTAKTLDVVYEQVFVLPNEEKIGFGRNICLEQL